MADQLKAAAPSDRAGIYETMYDELFREVPDHPRLTRRRDQHATRVANRSKLPLLRPFLLPSSTVLEFGAGDCAFLAAIADQVAEVVAVDISDQRDPSAAFPLNFRHVVYDGFNLDQIEPSSIDIAFSDQLIEHLHPDTIADHLRLVAGLLRPGGRYVLRTPHPMNGPHDVSKYFADVAEGFHLKEWTYSELQPLVLGNGFSQMQARWSVRRINIPVPMMAVKCCEGLLSQLPTKLKRWLSTYLMPTVSITAVKQ